MTVKQMIGVAMIVIILLCTILGLAGVWGLITGDTAWQLFWTLVVVAIGLGTTGAMVDRFFGEKKP